MSLSSCSGEIKINFPIHSKIIHEFIYSCFVFFYSLEELEPHEMSLDG